MDDVFMALGAILLVAAAFLASEIAGLVLLGVFLLVVGFALSDGKGLSWRS